MKQHNRNLKVYNVLSFRRLHVHMHAYVTIINLCQFETKKEKNLFYSIFSSTNGTLLTFASPRSAESPTRKFNYIKLVCPKNKTRTWIVTWHQLRAIRVFVNANPRKLIFNQLGLGGDISYAIIFIDTIYVFSTFSLFFYICNVTCPSIFVKKRITKRISISILLLDNWKCDYFQI